MPPRSRYSVWTIVAPIALVGVFALAVVLVAGPLTAPAPPPDPEPAAATAEAGAQTVAVGADVPPTYRIRRGDTLSAIAQRYGVTEEHIRALNPGLDPLALIPGERLKLRDAA